MSSFLNRHAFVRALSGLLAAVFIPSAAWAIPTNLAPSGVASTTSVEGYGSVAADGNDGNRDGSFGLGSVFHTLDNAVVPGTWQVDLGANKVLDRIQIFPRTDAIQNSVENFRIDVFDSVNTNVFSKVYLAGSNTGDTNWGTTDVRNVVGSRVVISRLDTSPAFLTFSEFEVFGQDQGKIQQNLALTATLTSSSLPGFGSQNADAIDGDINGHFNRLDTTGIGSSGPVYHSADQGVGEFLQLDFGSTKALDYINLFSRSDGVTTNNVLVEVLDSSLVTVFSQVLNLNGTDLGALRYNQTIDLPGAFGLKGQFVRITTQDNNFLALAEVEVFEQAIPEPTSLVLLGAGALALLRRRKEHA